jgi:rare lipoprotein A
MLSSNCAGNSYVRVTSPTHRDAPLISRARSRKLIQVAAVVLGAASLAACSQTTIATRNSEFLAYRQLPLQHVRTASYETKKRVAVAKKHTPFASRRNTIHSETAASRSNAHDSKTSSQGLASFYREGAQTASGEKFDARELTAAHPTLPFGTKLRVTDVKSGRTVTVRVNDRGPYVAGRVVDVSYSAAEELGIVGKGVANVKLDVVQ